MKKKKTPRNKFEREIHKSFKPLKLKAEYEILKIPYTIHGIYNPDWVVTGKAKSCIIEAKGLFRPEAKRKMAAVKQQHPHLDIRIIFYRYKKTDVRWAEKHGFPYSVGTFPQEWVEELNGRL